MIKEYNEIIDYKDLCIQFACKKEKTNNNLKHWEEVYKNIDEIQRKNACNMDANRFWYCWLLRDLGENKKHAKINDAIAEYESMQGIDQGPNGLWAFVTIGFNPQTITINKMKNACKKVREMSLWEYCDNVLELHRENGEHHHSHFLVKLKDKNYYYTSNIVKYIFQKMNAKYNGDIILNKACIDVKGPCNKKQMHANFEVYYDYVRGKKKEKKMPYVYKDRIWRKENEIDDLYEKV